MKKIFVHTKNVAEFVSVASKLKTVEAGVPGMGLVHGNRGFGKTSSAVYFSKQKENEAVYLLGKKEWNYAWMMEELCIELGVTPRRGAKAKYDDIMGALVDIPRLVIIDETNLVTPSLLETLRGLHDATHNPFLFIGHEGVVGKLTRMGPLFDRLLYVSEFKPLDVSDLRHFTEKNLEIGVDLVVLERVIRKTCGNFRKSVVYLKLLENRARASRLDRITERLLEERKAA